MRQGDFKKALETIAFILHNSIVLGTAFNSGSEVTISSRFNPETSTDLNSQVSTTVESDAVSCSDSETSEALRSNSSTSVESETSQKSITGDAYVNDRDEVTRL